MMQLWKVRSERPALSMSCKHCRSEVYVGPDEFLQQFRVCHTITASHRRGWVLMSSCSSLKCVMQTLQLTGVCRS